MFTYSDSRTVGGRTADVFATIDGEGLVRLQAEFDDIGALSARLSAAEVAALVGPVLAGARTPEAQAALVEALLATMDVRGVGAGRALSFARPAAAGAMAI